MNETVSQWARYQKRIRNVIEYIHENPGGTLTSDALAEVAHLSPYHWHRIYKAITGESAAATVKRCRMHKAAATLLRTDVPLPEVGASVGFPDIHSFTRTFKTYYGIAPGKFRAEQAEPPLDTATEPQPDTTQRSVEIVTKPDVRLAGLWHQGDYMTIGATFEKVMAQCSMAGLMPEWPQTVGVYFADPDAKPEADLKSFAGLVVESDSTIPDDLESHGYTGGRFAVLTHKGPYALLGQSYDWLYSKWLPAAGESIRDQPCSELYMNSPIDTAPQELLTEVCLPLL